MATSYANSGGTGDRRTLVKVTVSALRASGGSLWDNLVDGAVGNNTTDSINFAGSQTTVEVIFDWGLSGFKQVIDEFQWEQSNASTQGNYDWHGSDDGVSWTSLKANFDLVGGVTTNTLSYTNSTAYRFYRLKQVSGNTSSSPWIHEITFKIEQGAAIADPIPSYANAGGTGDRTATITASTTATLGGGTISNIVDGATAANSTDSFFFDNGQSSKVVKFDFGTDDQIVNEMRWKQSTTLAQGVWQAAGSHDDAAYTDIAGPQMIGGDAHVGGESLFGLGANTVGYQYYRFTQVSGTTSSNPWVQEAEFSIDVASASVVEIPASTHSIGITMSAFIATDVSAAAEVGITMAAILTSLRQRQPVIIISA